VLTRQTAAAVGVGTYWPWETTATFRSARRREALRRPRGRRGAGAYRGGRRPTACYYLKIMFADSYNENSHECASGSNMLYTVFSWRRNDAAESSSLPSGAGNAFALYCPATVKLRGP